MKMVYDYEKMPQTVPTNEFSSSVFDYATDFTADTFDLSLLPSNLDSQVPGSGSNFQQILSLYSENSSLPMFTSGPIIGKESDLDIKTEDGGVGEITYDLILSIKKEPTTGSFFQTSNLDAFSSPSPPFQQCPASPETDSTTTDMVLQSLKQEMAMNIQDMLDELKFAQKQSMLEKMKKPEKTSFVQTPVVEEKPELESETVPLITSTTTAAEVTPKVTPATSASATAEDHQLLREVLKDTSFQKKYQLKPIDIGDLGTAFQVVGGEKESKPDELEVIGVSPPEPKIKQENGELAKDNIFGVDLSQEGIGPVFTLALEQLKKDVHSTSTILGISRDPVQWSEEDVKCWVLWNLRQYSLPLGTADFFNMKGSELITLTEEKFQEISSQSGSLLHAQLEIWKAVCLEDTHLDVSNLLYDSPAQSNASSMDLTDEEEEDEEMVAIESLTSPRTTGGGKMSGRGSGSHIHLWQFLKELLASPQAHCSCIRWLDRSKGVFKIEDSVKVARLWGMRKNRPAMNYDKLSRSIRQYYKKGIMKKTERSQRLVYQFCHPYSL